MAIQIRSWQLQIPTLEGYTNRPLGFIRDSIDDSRPDAIVWCRFLGFTKVQGTL